MNDMVKAFSALPEALKAVEAFRADVTRLSEAIALLTKAVTELQTAVETETLSRDPVASLYAAGYDGR